MKKSALLAVGVLIAACSETPSEPLLTDLPIAAAKTEAPDGLVYNEFNGNYYLAVEDPGISWSDANTAAMGIDFDRCEPHLATVTSQNENDWIATTFEEAAPSGYWLGGKQEAGSEEPGGGWTWVTGEPWVFSNWSQPPFPPEGEPNNFGEFNEESLHFRPSIWGSGDGTWNDIPDAYLGAGGYIVEFDCGRKVTGGGQVLWDVLGDGSLIQTRVYGFAAHVGTDTRVKGQAQGVFLVNDVETDDFHMEVTCVSTWGNEAWLGAIVTESTLGSSPVGRSYVWRVVDNGQGGAADEDRLSFYVYYAGEARIDHECALQETDGFLADQFELSNGNLTIH